MMIRPPFLKPGDKVAIVAPGKKILPQDIDAAMTILPSWGLEIVHAKNLFSTEQYYLAGTDEQRLRDYQEMLDDASVRAIINARGGYGSTRIIDQLDFSLFKKSPKWIVGYSDITAIHLKLLRQGYECIQGIMPIAFAKDDAPDSLLSLKNALFGNLTGIKAAPAPQNRSGKSRGELIGGNLSLVADAIGTSSDPLTDGKILILEEIDEYLYRIDRMIVHLKRAGKLKNLAGLIIGHMTDIHDTELRFGETVQQLISNHVKEFQYPVAFNFPTGHEHPNFSWVQGAVAAMSVDNGGLSLRYETTS